MPIPWGRICGVSRITGLYHQAQLKVPNLWTSPNNPPRLSTDKANIQDGHNPLVLLSTSTEGSRGMRPLTSLCPVDAASHEWSHGKFLFQFCGCYPHMVQKESHGALSWELVVFAPHASGDRSEANTKSTPTSALLFPISNVWWGILQRTECIRRWEFIQSKKNIPVALLSSSLVPAWGAVLLGGDGKFLHMWFSMKDYWVIFQCVLRITRATVIGSRFDNGHNSLLGFLQYKASVPPS